MQMAEPFSIIKLITGIPKASTIGKSLAIGFWLLIFAGIIYGGYLGYKKIMQRTESYQQKAEHITNYEYTLEPHQTFGCMNFKVNRSKLDDRQKQSQKP